ncbi:hypothetical protein [Amycolatopsis minnesotensis]|uniref:HTTM-like domain-containing protein n=1 Tax=Amycolatopsis minnesotensis TaxID=337894 RepID=A0ABP5DY19_9PSEU
MVIGRHQHEVVARRVASLGTLVSALEMLSQSARFEQGELLSTQLDKIHPKFAKRFPRLVEALSSKGASVGLYAAQAAASAATIAWPRSRRVQFAGAATLAATGAAGRMRNPFGGDGADQLQQVINVTFAATAALKDREKARDLTLRTLALETTISYLASGLVKVVSPVWLAGDAFEGIIRTRNYGDPRVHRLVTRYPVLGKLVSWGTIAAELGFPLVFVLPPPAARAYLGMMTSFHLGIGQFMGLNRFVLAFGATHPAILHVLSERSRRPAEGG